VRESLRFIHQRERFVSSLVRPLLWLFIFAAGFRQVLGVSIVPPYKTYVLYETYITPGLCGMILLFSGMQSSLSMVYDREMGNMRTLLVSPFPRWFLLAAKLLAGVAVSVLQVYVFLAVARLWGVKLPLPGYLLAFPALIFSGLMLGALGMFLSSVIKQLENFLGTLPALARQGIEPDPLRHLPVQSVHLRRRARAFCLLRPRRMALADRGRPGHNPVHGRRHRGLRSRARPHGPQAGHGRKRVKKALLVVLSVWAAPAFAAQGTDPDWPCIQPKVPTVSPAQFWNGPALTLDPSAAVPEDIQDLARDISKRRMPIDEAQAKIKTFAGTHANDKLGQLFQAVFQELTGERAHMLSGISRYAHTQAEIAAAIRKESADVDALRAKPDVDLAELDRRSGALTMQTRMFEERVQSLTYVCEVPTLIEQRLYALAKAIAAEMKAR
jgi:ABC-2 type transporter